MKSAIAILTYNRRPVLERFIRSIEEHCPNTPVAIFEDAGYLDDTAAWLKSLPGMVYEKECWEIEAEKWSNGKIEVYLGTRNIGVAGSSNRALAWFIQREYDHLCLCNDDVLATGDFPTAYATTHAMFDMGLYCFCKMPERGYELSPIMWRGVQFNLLTRLTGSMMSITRRCVDAIGFFDTTFYKFGNEHCDYTYRASLSGFVNLDGMMHTGVDIEHSFLAHQTCESSILEEDRPFLDQVAQNAMDKASRLYRVSDHYRPFGTSSVYHAGGRLNASGIPVGNLLGYALLNQRETGAGALG